MKGVTMPQTESRLEAFEAARSIVSLARANEILRWKNWEHGGVLGGAPKPSSRFMRDFPRLSREEHKAIHRLWMTLDGSSCWMSALYMLRNDERPTK